MNPRRLFLLIFLYGSSPVISLAQLPRLIIPTGNTGMVDHVEFSEDGKYLVSTFGSDEIILWNMSTKDVFNRFNLPGRVTDILIDGNAKIVAGASIDGSLGIWKYEGKDSRKIFHYQSAMNGLAYFPESHQVISCNSDTTIKITDPETGATIFRMDTGDPLDIIRFNHTGNQAAFGDRKGKIFLFDIKTREKEMIYKISESPVRDICYSEDDSQILAGDAQGMIYLLNLDPLKIIYSFRAFGRQVHSISFYKNMIIATGRDDKKNLRFFRRTDGKEEDYLPDFREDTQSPSFIYGIYTHAVSAEGILAVPYYDGTIQCWNLSSKREDFILKGQSEPIYDIELADNGFIYYTTDTKVGGYDLEGQTGKKVFFSSKYPLFQVSHNSKDIAALGSDTSIYIIDPANQEIKLKFKVSDEAFAAPVRLLSTNKLVYRNNPASLAIKDLASGKIKILKIENCYQYKFNASQSRLIALSNKKDLQVRDAVSFKLLKKIPAPGMKTFDINPGGNLVAGIYKSDGHESLKTIQWSDNKVFPEINIPDSITIDKLFFSNDDQTVLSISRSTGKFNEAGDNSIRIWDIRAGKYIGKLVGQSALVSDIEFLNNNIMLSGSSDGTIRVWSLLNKKELASIIPFSNGEWVVINPDGLYDASPQAMKKLHFIFNNEEISLNQLKENFYEPNLLQKILGYTDEPLSVKPAGNQYSLYPEIHLVPPDFNEGILTASFQDRGGGIGKISILINGKEAVEDARNLFGYDTVRHSFNYTVLEHPFLKPGALNKVTLVVYNEKGYKIRNEKSIYLLSDKAGGGTETPDLYAVIIGISDYRGNDIDLKYAAKDAEDFASAIQLGASKYLGEDHVFIHRLTSIRNDSLQWPLKRNIEKTFSSIAGKAQPKDILLVYISGHGMDNADDNEFYFLTADAGTKSISDPMQRPGVTLSSSNLVKLVRQVPALKQLMIVDACHSGNVLSGLASGSSQMNSESIRALEQVKDRTGMYILASSEGQDVSYESSVFDQGLLTYSLLFGLKGAGLREGEMADVVGLLQFVNSNLPVLASDIGKVQKPVIKIPDDVSSFNIGKLTIDEKDKIDIKSPKPVVVRSNFQNEITFIDDLQIAPRLDASLKDYRDMLNNKFIFLDEGNFNNAIIIYGRYRKEKEKLVSNYKVYKNNNLLKEDTISAGDPEDLVKIIAEKVLVIIDQQK